MKKIITIAVMAALVSGSASAEKKYRLEKLGDVLAGTAVGYSSDSEGAIRVPVIEEATSTGCGWCIRGLFTLEYIAEAYPGTFIALAYHSDFNGVRDPMVSVTGQSWIGRYAQGSFPYAVVNRKEPSGVGEFMDFYKIKEYVDGLYARLRAERVFAGVEVAAEPSAENAGRLDVDVTLNFPLDIPGGDSERYRISIAVTEDGLGPYQQYNYYSGTVYDGKGYEKRANKPKLVHNHVVLELCGVNGIRGSVPSGLAKGDTHRFSQQVDVSRATGDKVNVVAMLIDSATDEIINAASVESSVRAEEPEVPGSGGVDTVGSDGTGFSARGGFGCISVDGADCRVEVYATDGTLVKAVSHEQLIHAAPGLYIVRCGGKAEKVYVR